MTPTKAFGITQPDVIVRTMLIQAIRDMKKNPWMLDFVFSSLPNDDLTSAEYGQKEVDAAKRWFLDTDIPVISANIVSQPSMPCISIALQESREDKNTLGDTHYFVSEDLSDPWPVIVGPFTPESYSVATGAMVIPLADVGDAVLSDNMVVVDVNGTEHPIVEVTDINEVLLAEGTVANFRNATIRGAKPSYRVALESAAFTESYVIGCHTSGDPIQLLYLHSLVVFAILRYRETLLEARGIDNTSISSTDLQQNNAFETELVYSRYVTISGTVRHYWPKLQQPKIQSVSGVPSISTSETTTIEAVDILG